MTSPSWETKDQSLTMMRWLELVLKSTETKSFSTFPRGSNYVFCQRLSFSVLAPGNVLQSSAQKKKKEQLEKIPGITNQISSEYSNNFFENPEKKTRSRISFAKGFLLTQNKGYSFYNHIFKSWKTRVEIITLMYQ